MVQVKICKTDRVATEIAFANSAVRSNSTPTDRSIATLQPPPDLAGARPLRPAFQKLPVCSTDALDVAGEFWRSRNPPSQPAVSLCARRCNCNYTEVTLQLHCNCTAVTLRLRYIARATKCNDTADWLQLHCNCESLHAPPSEAIL